MASGGESQILTLGTLARGAAVERFEDALEEVLKNIRDPNTSAKAERAVTLVVRIKPSDNRERADITVDCKAKLAPPEGVGDVIYFGQDRSGKIVATRYDPQQLELTRDPEDRSVLPLNAKQGGQSS